MLTSMNLEAIREKKHPQHTKNQTAGVLKRLGPRIQSSFKTYPNESILYFSFYANWRGFGEIHFSPYTREVADRNVGLKSRHTEFQGYYKGLNINN